MFVLSLALSHWTNCSVINFSLLKDEPKKVHFPIFVKKFLISLPFLLKCFTVKFACRITKSTILTWRWIVEEKLPSLLASPLLSLTYSKHILHIPYEYLFEIGCFYVGFLTQRLILHSSRIWYWEIVLMIKTLSSGVHISFILCKAFSN